MIVWNRVTWYSKYLALVFFTIVFPIWTFYLGTQYQIAKNSFLEDSFVGPILNNSSSTPIVESKPTSTSPQQLSSGIKGVVTIGPTCPVEKIPPDPDCADKSYQANLVAIHRTTAVQTRFSSSIDGKFLVDLPPGDYSIRNDSTAVLPRMEDYEITVREGKYTDLDIKFDSGIR